MGKTRAGDGRNNRRHDNIKLVVHKLLYTENTTAENELKPTANLSLCTPHEK
jgi:hypothetical protein